MVAVANIWLFFYTPQYGLIAQVMQLFGAPGPNWLGDRATALPALMLVTVWKEAGFFMIFYLAALRRCRRRCARRPCWRVALAVFPARAVAAAHAHHAVRADQCADQRLPPGRPRGRDDQGRADNASTLLLYYIYQVGFSFWDTAYAATLTVVLLVVLALTALIKFRWLDRGRTTNESRTLGAWALGLLWILPLAYAMWAAFHPPAYATRFDLFAPLTLDNFVRAWNAAPFPRYFLNTFLLVTMVLAAQLVLSTLAGYAFARFEFRGRDFVFMLVLLQLMIMPDVLLVENYRSMSQLGIRDTVFAIGLPYFASAFGIFLLRQTFKTVPRELEEAARMEGANALQVLMKVYVPLAKPIYVAYGLVSVSHHWNNFLWPLIITNSVESRPLTVGLQVFSSTDQGIDWSVITAATLMSAAPLLIAFLLFQRQFVQSFMRAGIR